MAVNSTFVARVFSSFEVTSRGAGISLCESPGLAPRDFFVRSWWWVSVVVSRRAATERW